MAMILRLWSLSSCHERRSHAEWTAHQDRFPCSRDCPGRFCQPSLQPSSPFRGLATHVRISSTFIVPRAEPSPGSQVDECGGKTIHVYPDFSQDDFRHCLLDSRDCLQKLDLLQKRARRFSTSFTHLFNRFIQKIKMREDLPQQKTMMRAKASLEGSFNRRKLVAQSTLGQICQYLRIGTSERMACIIALSRAPSHP